MYDAFSSDYDRFVNWPSRLAYELPFLLRNLETAPGEGKLRVLDAACGTGMHAIALAQKGMDVSGADLSAGMIDRARENARQAAVGIDFHAAGFGELARAFLASGGEPFGALLCLGNSLPHLLDPGDLRNALEDFAACLRPGGLLFLQNRNFDSVMRARERWMEPQSHREGSGEWIFLRFYDYLANGLIDFNIVTLHRAEESAWRQQVTTTQLRPLLQAEALEALAAAGLGEISCFGDMTGRPFDPAQSGNLIITARKL